MDDVILSIMFSSRVESLRAHALELFYKSDPDHDGFLSLPEFKALLVSLTTKLTEQEIQQLFDFLDKDNRGRVSMDQFLGWICSKEAHDTDAGHQDRGLSAHCFATVVQSEVHAAGLNRDANIYEMEPLVILPKGAYRVCPRDGRLGCAYVDAVSGHANAGLSDFLVSYTWGYTIGDITDTLQAFCSTRACESTSYFWMCWACINQHRVKKAQREGLTVPFEHFKNTFGQRVISIGKILAMVAPWRNPTLLDRVWCVFELYLASVTAGIEVLIAMPPREAEDFAKTIFSDLKWQKNVWNSLESIAVEHAHATVEEDRQRILGLIKDGPGFTETNGSVSKVMQNWMVDSALQHLDTCKASTDRAECQRALAANCGVGRLLALLERLEASEIRYRQAKTLHVQLGTLESEGGLEILYALAVVLARQRKVQEALDIFDECKRLRELSGSLATPAGAKLLMSIGVNRRDLKDFDGALKAFAEALKVRQATKSLESADGANLINSMGVVKAMMGNLTGALQDYRQALAIREKFDLLGNLDGVKLLTNFGRVAMELGDTDAGMEALGRAHFFCQDTGTLETRPGKELLRVLKQLGVEHDPATVQHE